jgi:hypothetical protein
VKKTFCLALLLCLAVLNGSIAQAQPKICTTCDPEASVSMPSSSASGQKAPKASVWNNPAEWIYGNQHYTIGFVLDEIKKTHGRYGLNYQVTLGTDREKVLSQAMVGDYPKQPLGQLLSQMLKKAGIPFHFDDTILTIVGPPLQSAANQAPTPSAMLSDPAVAAARIRADAATITDPKIKDSMLEAAARLEQSAAVTEKLNSATQAMQAHQEKLNAERIAREAAALERTQQPQQPAPVAANNPAPQEVDPSPTLPPYSPMPDMMMPGYAEPRGSYDPRRIVMYPPAHLDPTNSAYYSMNYYGPTGGSSAYLYTREGQDRYDNQRYGGYRTVGGGYGHNYGNYQGGYTGPGYSNYGWHQRDPASYARAVRNFQRETQIAAFNLRGNDRFLCGVEVFVNKQFKNVGCKLNNRNDAKEPVVPGVSSTVTFVAKIDDKLACFSLGITPERMADYFVVNRGKTWYFTIPVDRGSFSKKNDKEEKVPTGLFDRSTQTCNMEPSTAP